MLESDSTNGSIETSTAEKQELAEKSLAFNCTQPKFLELFPELMDLHHELIGLGEDNEEEVEDKEV